METATNTKSSKIFTDIVNFYVNRRNPVFVNYHEVARLYKYVLSSDIFGLLKKYSKNIYETPLIKMIDVIMLHYLQFAFKDMIMAMVDENLVDRHFYDGALTYLTTPGNDINRFAQLEIIYQNREKITAHNDKIAVISKKIMKAYDSYSYQEDLRMMIEKKLKNIDQKSMEMIFENFVSECRNKARYDHTMVDKRNIYRFQPNHDFSSYVDSKKKLMKFCDDNGYHYEISEFKYSHDSIVNTLKRLNLIDDEAKLISDIHLALDKEGMGSRIAEFIKIPNPCPVMFILKLLSKHYDVIFNVVTDDNKNIIIKENEKSEYVYEIGVYDDEKYTCPLEKKYNDVRIILNDKIEV